MGNVIVAGQLLAISGLIFETVVLSWRAGDKFWSSRSSR